MLRPGTIYPVGDDRNIILNVDGCSRTEINDEDGNRVVEFDSFFEAFASCFAGRMTVRDMAKYFVDRQTSTQFTLLDCLAQNEERSLSVIRWSWMHGYQHAKSYEVPRLCDTACDYIDGQVADLRRLQELLPPYQFPRVWACFEEAIGQFSNLKQSIQAKAKQTH